MRLRSLLPSLLLPGLRRLRSLYLRARYPGLWHLRRLLLSILTLYGGRRNAVLLRRALGSRSNCRLDAFDSAHIDYTNRSGRRRRGLPQLLDGCCGKRSAGIFR